MAVVLMGELIDEADPITRMDVLFPVTADGAFGLLGGVAVTPLGVGKNGAAVLFYTQRPVHLLQTAFVTMIFLPVRPVSP